MFLNSGFTLKFISFSFTFCHSDVLENTRDNMQMRFVVKYLFFLKTYLFFLFVYKFNVFNINCLK